MARKKLARRTALKTKKKAKRAYDIAKTFPTSEWTSATKADANADTKAAIAPGREKARSLVQNNPYARKGVNILVSEVVGTGIMAQITGRTKSQTKKLMDLWRSWAETTACDAEEQLDFYGLQKLVMNAAIEAGEGLALKKFDKNGPKIHVIEADFIDTSKDSLNNKQGVEQDNFGRRLGYHLFKVHPGSATPSTETLLVPADQVAHIYRKERPGQARGVTSLAPVMEKLKDFEDYQSATIIRQKMAACIVSFIQSPANDTTSTADELQAKRELEQRLSPGSVRYLDPGETVSHSNPPGVDGYADFNRETLRAVAAGLGITYESLSGDYSQSNYSSSRLGHIQMRKNIDKWRWDTLVPMFCDRAFKWFLEWAMINGLVTREEIQLGAIKVKWVPPAFTSIDPGKEVAALKEEVRAGFKSMPEALLELGRDPEQTLLEISEWNEKLDQAKVALDTDPRRLSGVGFAQSSDPLAPPSAEDTESSENPEGEKNETPDGTEEV